MSDQKENMKNLNPQIQKTMIGVRNLREIIIYPLSWNEQIKLGDLITQGVQSFMAIGANNDDIKSVKAIIDLINENIGRLIELVTDEKKEDILSDITNEQVADFATVVYDMNYGGAKKKLMELFKKAKSK